MPVNLPKCNLWQKYLTFLFLNIKILSRLYVMLVWLFGKLHEQYSQAIVLIVQINKAFQGNKILHNKE